MPAIDRHEELVEIPRVAEPAAPLSEPSCVGVTERTTPLPNGLVGDRDATLGEEVFHITETQAEAKVDPNGVGRPEIDIRGSSARDCSFRYSDIFDLNLTVSIIPMPVGVIE